MKNLNIELAKIILHELIRQPLNRTELEKRTTRKAGTHATFENAFSYIVREGYVQKSSPKYRAKYIITDKGTMLLKAIKQPKN
ncbi:MAG: winged helix-turn-helix domain-containing protein [Candidatus Bathyarchaeota archaeon]|nr:winged helix-turn-helix domain-containing protein [Candidatus Bathyarchaeota archaeon]